jgi:hypothetical protein
MTFLLPLNQVNHSVVVIIAKAEIFVNNYAEDFTKFSKISQSNEK